MEDRALLLNEVGIHPVDLAAREGGTMADWVMAAMEADAAVGGDSRCTWW